MIGKEKKKVKKEAKELPQKTLKKVEFTFQAPEAMEVLLAGAFNSWDTQTLLMNKNKEGVWKTEINLAPGCYEYKFLADGVWVENISGVETAPNPYGTRNLVTWVK
jgi:1,4-alpha-glucan branching enzyme